MDGISLFTEGALHDPANLLVGLAILAALIVAVGSWLGYPLAHLRVPYNFVAPTAFTYVALLFGRHVGLTVEEQWALVIAMFLGVWSILPQSK
jgi:hypothetical protein